jgi:putative addiction module antidote
MARSQMARRLNPPVGVRKVGGSLVVILPKEALERLKIAEGDTVSLTEAPGAYRIVNYDPALEQEMESARRMAKKWRPVLRQLAK